MGLSAKPEDIEAAAKHVETVNGELQTQISNLRNLVDGSGAFWAGDAEVAFKRLMDGYDASSRKVHESLGEIAQNIRKNAQGYDQQEQANLTAIHAAGESGSLTL